jgi:hypothetical protein
VANPISTVAMRVARFGLPGTDPDPIDVPWESWPSFVAALEGQRLTGIALAAAQNGVLVVDQARRNELAERHARAMMLALVVERKLLTLGKSFGEASVDVVALKGPTMAHTIYPDPSWRPFGDLDLLVRTEDWQRATALLRRMGFDRRLPEPRPGFDERFGKAAVHMNGDGVEVDLHRTLVLGPFGLWMDPTELFGRTEVLSLAGREVRRLDDTAMLVHACVHASLGWTPPLIMPLRDVAQAANTGRIDWDAFSDLVRRWRLRAVVRHAFETAQATLGTTLPAEAIHVAQGRSKRVERKALASYIAGRRARGGTAISTLRALPGIRGKSLYIRALVFPSRSFLDRRASGRGSYWRRWLVPVRWMTRSPRRR